MAETPEQKLEKGNAIWDMTQSTGWQIIKNQIESEIEIETNELLDCPAEEVEQHRAAVKAYKKVLDMVETAEKEKQEAAESIREKE